MCCKRESVKTRRPNNGYWKATHFFGGAMDVFTTQTLLASVGVSKHRATLGAVAINWILKDGAGWVGKLHFSRQGKKFDYDLKQLRFASDLLMELGAGVELATAVVPYLFLPLACAANVAKNVGAVTSTSTLTPIYKAFAKGENIRDVTAKGECVGNVANLYFRDFEVETIGLKETPRSCSSDDCGARLKDTVVDWEDALPPKELNPAEKHCKVADAVLCLGTSLQITPACNLPLKSLRGGGKFVFVSLQFGHVLIG